MSFSGRLGHQVENAKGAPIVVGPAGSPVTPARVLRPPTGPRTVVLVVGDGIHCATVTHFCDRVRALLVSGDAELVTCDVAELVAPDATSVDALARLQLAARRSGGSIRLRHAQRRLRDLLALLGLDGVLPLRPDLAVDPDRQPEHREEVGLDEEVDRRDPTV
jgi:ABC-type transporter Mla MlaB component